MVHSPWLCPRLALLGLAVMLLGACTQVLPPPADPVRTPLLVTQPGHTLLYRVQDTTYRTALVTDSNGFQKDTILPVVDTYELKTVVGDTLTDLTGRRLHILDRYRRPSSQAAYTFDHRWTLHLGTTFVERQEGTQRYLVLQLPPTPTAAWDGNAYNNQGAQTFRYLSLDTTVAINGQTYPNCVAVLWRQELDSRLREALTYEIYAPNLGLVERRDVWRTYDFRDLGGGIQQRVLSTESYGYHQTLLPPNPA